MQLSSAKTKLLVFSKDETDYVKYTRLVNPIHIGKSTINFVESAEHVGVLRSTSGNLPHIFQRIVSHKKALGCILSMGISRHHRASPLSSIRAEQIYAAPVLFSGVATLLLNQNEVDIISMHIKETIQKLLKLQQYIHTISRHLKCSRSIKTIKTVQNYFKLCPDNTLTLKPL